MIKVICIRWGTKFPKEYVNKLFRGIKNNTSKEFSFVCYTNIDEPLDPEILIEPIPHFTGDWFSKISLYNKELHANTDRVFFFDLDTVITGNLDEIFEYEGDFAICRDFYRPRGLQSCFMSWRPHAVDHMAKNYRGQKCAHGDQGWCEQQYANPDIWQDMYPGQVASYKVNIRDKNTSRGIVIDENNIRVLCFHGKPMPHEVEEYWN